MWRLYYLIILSTNIIILSTDIFLITKINKSNYPGNLILGIQSKANKRTNFTLTKNNAIYKGKFYIEQSDCDPQDPEPRKWRTNDTRRELYCL